MYCQDTQSAILKEVKGLTNKLYAYALVRKKTCLHAKFIGAMVNEFRFFKKKMKKKEMDNL